MSKMTLDFKEKQHVLEVDGVEYEIPSRTQAIENKIAERDEKVGKVSELESNMELLTIFFGEENVDKMFPDKENTNLDKLAKCVKYALALYYTESQNVKMEDVKEKLNELNPLLESVGKLTNAANTMRTAQFVGNKPKRHKKHK